MLEIFTSIDRSKVATAPNNGIFVIVRVEYGEGLFCGYWGCGVLHVQFTFTHFAYKLEISSNDTFHSSTIEGKWLF